MSRRPVLPVDELRQLLASRMLLDEYDAARHAAGRRIDATPASLVPYRAAAAKLAMARDSEVAAMRTFVRAVLEALGLDDSATPADLDEAMAAAKAGKTPPRVKPAWTQERADRVLGRIQDAIRKGDR